MDNRFAGLLIVVLALLFLWLYDTGRWALITAIFKGVAPVTASGNQIGVVPANYGATCAIWPSTCIDNGQGGVGSTGGTGGNSGAATGGTIGGTIGSIIPGIGTTIGSILGSIFGGLFG